MGYFTYFTGRGDKPSGEHVFFLVCFGEFLGFLLACETLSSQPLGVSGALLFFLWDRGMG